MPTGKFGEAASFFNKTRARGENKMIGISEDTLRTKFAHLGVSDSFNGSAGGGANESWGLNIAVWRMDDASAHESLLLGNVEF